VEYTVGEVARVAGVTVRTLHHYDEIGLLTPGGRTAAGYRLYDHADLVRLQRILGYRALGFALDKIGAILDDPDVDPLQHLRGQHALLGEHIAVLQGQLAVIEKTMEAYTMGIRLTPKEMFEVFGDHDATEHADEAEERWGGTDAYRASQRRTSAYTKEDWQRLQAETQAIEGDLLEAFLSGAPPSGDAAMDAAEAHRQSITRWFYECSYEIHRGLAEMYVADPRFTAHYDQHAQGLAQYVHDAMIANADRAR
jgi:MerR family transcriptional regulator, thiopeptide resistance regulator